MGNQARDVLFRMPAHASARRYTLFKVTSIHELGARTSSCNDSETALTQMAEIIIYCTDQTLTFIIVRELCTLTHAEAILKKCAVTRSRFFFKYQIRRERVAENETITSRRERMK